MPRADSAITSHHEQSSVPKILGLHHIELYVGDVRHASHYFQTAFGFEPIAHIGLETGVRDRASIVLQQGLILLVLTSGPGPDSEASNHILLARRWGERNCIFRSQC